MARISEYFFNYNCEKYFSVVSVHKIHRPVHNKRNCFCRGKFLDHRSHEYRYLKNGYP